MSDLGEMLRAQTEAISRAYINGHHVGYQEGFNAGLAEAKRILNKTFPEFVPAAQKVVA